MLSRVPRISRAKGTLLPRYSYSLAAGRSFHNTAIVRNYDSTLKNLKIGSHTRVIFQGFTGRQATANAKESIAWGTNIVGGVRPGREGEHLGLPVLPTVRKAMEVLKPDATGIYVAAHQATAAIEEAIEAEVPLIVAVAEHIPLHDLLRIHSVLKTQSASRLVGANSPGIISSVGKCRIGFQPLPCFEPGRIGIVARSGTLSYETAASTLRSGLGQSMSIGVGGDVLPGTTLKDGLQILVEDKDTEAIALIGEIGGDAEIEAADWIMVYRSRTEKPKPIAAIIGGINAVPGRIMGHAGAFTLPGEPSALAKVEALKAAGATIINHPSRFGPVLKAMLEGSKPSGGGVSPPGSPNQRRALDLLRQRGIPVIDDLDSLTGPRRLLAVTVNRSTRNPCIIASPSTDAVASKKFDFDYGTRGQDLPLPAIAAHLGLDANSTDSLRPIISGLIDLFTEKEAFLLSTHIVSSTRDDSGNNNEQSALAIADAHPGFDDAAFSSSGRQSDIQALRDASPSPSAEETHEAAAAREGIVYIRLPDPRGNIGTLVNGAGLAMNTVDALADAGGRAANFLDTGGKATSETVKRSFELVLTDARVKCIFVNIFGGLTLGDMIARGVVLAFRDLRMSVPVVVRIRGTNEQEGQRIIAESGLPLFAFDDFDEAAAKAIELASEGLSES